MTFYIVLVVTPKPKAMDYSDTLQVHLKLWWKGTSSPLSYTYKGLKHLISFLRSMKYFMHKC